MFMAFMSIERHFLVFRHQIYRRRRLKYILHYFPILLLVLWSFTYSIVTDVFLTCPQQRFRYTRFLCGYTCSLLMKQASLIYIWVQVFFPTLVTTVACILLPIRFMFQKKTLQRLQWRRARKMIIQMTVIAITYTISWIPYTVIIHLASAELLSLGSDPIASFMIFLPYIPSLLTPFICLYTISERLKFNTMKQIIYFCFPHRKNVVHVRTTVIIPNQNHTANLANTNLVNKRPTLTKS
ncbi:hypothetical protein I4U23_008685 [Adineta vaga]|nr:hypothetical protein I4U23_008685 [Adineta vaga]